MELALENQVALIQMQQGAEDEKKHQNQELRDRLKDLSLRNQMMGKELAQYKENCVCADYKSVFLEYRRVQDSNGGGKVLILSEFERKTDQELIKGLKE